MERSDTRKGGRGLVLVIVMVLVVGGGEEGGGSGGAWEVDGGGRGEVIGYVGGE